MQLPFIPTFDGTKEEFPLQFLAVWSFDEPPKDFNQIQNLRITKTRHFSEEKCEFRNRRKARKRIKEKCCAFICYYIR